MRCEAFLREKGVDPTQVTNAPVAATPTAERQSERGLPEPSETVWHLPTPAPAAGVSGPQSTIFKPRILHKQKGTELVDK